MFTIESWTHSEATASGKSSEYAPMQSAMQLNSVQQDVVDAYSAWMLQKKQEIKDYYDHPDTPKIYKETVAAVFKQLDKDGSGLVHLDELLEWAADTKPRQGSKVPDEFIIAQFTRVDLDRSGGLDFEECLLLQYLGCMNMLWCGCCGAFIDSTKEDGFTCTTCYGKFGPREKPGERQLDLCVKCHKSGEAEKHAKVAGDKHSFVHLSDIKTPDTVVCASCGTEHGMVLGYMQGSDGDRHVRPLLGDPDTWVCELCALSSCPCGTSFKWSPEKRRSGLLFNNPSLAHAGGCKAGQPSLKERWIASSAARLAPHCTTCREALVAGTMPFPPEPVLPAAALAQGVQELTVDPWAFAAGPSVPGGLSTLLGKQVVCFCCQDVHDLTSALDGASVKGYLFANGFAEHVKQLPDGRYLCEWCAKYVCEKCGTHYSETAKPSPAKWSKLQCCPPSEGCEATRWGGLSSVKAGMRQKADDMARGHCRSCRHKIMTETLADLSAAPAPSLARASDGGGAAAAAAAAQTVVVCFCCQEIHDVTSALNQGRVEAYMPKEDFNEHTKAVADGKFVCEWCSKWMCYRCGALKWTDTRPGVGLWSESTFCCKSGCKPKDGAPHMVDKAVLRATAHDLSRMHCRVCREKIITGKLVERTQEPKAPPPGTPAAAPQKPPKKKNDFNKILGRGDGKSDCSIQ